MLFLIAYSIFSIIRISIQSDMNFICKSGHLLNEIEKICDGRADCVDGSDESIELCSHIFCPPNYFKCNYGACVPQTKKCNGIRDCVDSSDEANCGQKMNSCMASEFNCGSNTDGSDSYSCIEASRICDGIQDCVDGADENKTICENILCPEESYRCYYGGCVSQSLLCDGKIDCLDGSDESSELCISLKCPKCKNSIPCRPLNEFSLKSRRVIKQCEWNDRQMSCSQKILPGTKVSYACKNSFIPKTGRDFSNDWNLCQADGTWLRDMLECKPDCGRLKANIPNERQTMPWHASIFHGEENQWPKFICGATLISEMVIVTAAHCVSKFNIDNLRIGLGNLIAEFDNPDDFSAHFHLVQNVFIHPNYDDELASYESDIALIVIDEPVEFDDIISPICIDLNLDDISEHQIVQETGTIVILNSTNLTRSKSFRTINMPIILHQECIAEQPKEFQRYLAFTKFCAGWRNGTSPCNGDSGSGLATKRSDNRFYLQGIASLSPRQEDTDNCDQKQYTVFTKIGIYVKWLENHLNRINTRYNPLLSDDFITPRV